jgi:phenylacetic acid degradation operon negative regulatory protein
VRQEVVERRGSGTTGARGYLLTLLGEFVVPDSGQVWTAPVIDALGTLGIQARTTRQALARSAQRGMLESERVGRRTRWHVTDHARTLLTEGAKRIYGLHHDPHPWNGEWLLVFSTVPETTRALRYRLRTRLRWAGFAPIGPGAWVSPWAEREPEAADVLAELGIDGRARSFVGGLGRLGEGDARALVAEAWDLDGIARAYEGFVDELTGRRAAGERASFVAVTELVHHWRRFPFLEPDLPAELLPPRWAGHRAARLFHRNHRRWSPAAWRWWRARTAAVES